MYIGKGSNPASMQVRFRCVVDTNAYRLQTLVMKEVVIKNFNTKLSNEKKLIVNTQLF
jgi:hypothetical protein